ncbi:SDR family oxidoreductase [Burkholderia territorii]|uniref:SDR family oxidoreductase n=1 Tax=Burkholderia territorii TaxID=1503055 RepID=UPI000A4C242A|nr:SDR family oxidoreductase [Burkholderia territorii]
MNFTRALAGEGGRHGITDQCDRSGLFPFEHVTRVAHVDRVAAEVPLRRIGDSENLKGAVALFASDAGQHITGQILAVDGGATAVL